MSKWLVNLRFLPSIVNLARWLTTAGNILRLWCQTEAPSQVLTRLCYVILNVYLPSFFEIKERSHIKFGSPNYFGIVSRVTKCLEGTEVDIALG